MRMLRKMLVGLTAVIGSASAGAQQTPVPTAGSALSVYLDCRTFCDGDLIRTDINYVNWVRDRTVADVHLLITSQQAGAGGQEYTVALLGERAFAGRGDTLTVTTEPTATSDEQRRAVTQMIALGLVQFVVRTPAGRRLRLTHAAPSGGESTSQTNTASDPWKAWVFEIGVNGFLSGEKFYRNREMNFEFSAKRVTEAWKTNFEFQYSYSDNRATVQEFDSLGEVTSEETFKNLQRDWNAELLQVKSISNHLSLGAQLHLAQQTFRNQDLRYEARTAFEYNLFPYSENTRRELTFRYGIGVTGLRYADTTIFNKTRETLPSHFFEMSYRTRQPWGSANLNAEHRNYLNDASKRSSEVNGNLSVRLFKGFEVNFGGGYNWIRDQIYLPKGGQDQVDVLLRRRALLTGFEYFTHFGVSYTFGSIFNNVVNPRF
jgi:hypothetical protein